MVNPIVENNFRKMAGTDQDEMQLLLSRESIGGNSPPWRSPSGRVYGTRIGNFQYEVATGKILAFGNYPVFVDKVERGRFLAASYDASHRRLWWRYALGRFGTFLDRHPYIVSTELDLNWLETEGKTTDDARKVIEESIIKYNKNCGWEPK